MVRGSGGPLLQPWEGNRGIIAPLTGDGEQGWETCILLSLLATWPWGQSPGPWAGGRWKVSCPLTTLEPQVWDSGVRTVCPERTPSPVLLEEQATLGRPLGLSVEVPAALSRPCGR